MGADSPMLRSRQRGHRICHHPQCDPDEERPRRERRDEMPALDAEVNAEQEFPGVKPSRVGERDRTVRDCATS